MKVFASHYGLQNNSRDKSIWPEWTKNDMDSSTIAEGSRVRWLALEKNSHHSLTCSRRVCAYETHSSSSVGQSHPATLRSPTGRQFRRVVDGDCEIPWIRQFRLMYDQRERRRRVSSNRRLTLLGVSRRDVRQKDLPLALSPALVQQNLCPSGRRM